MEGRKEGRRRKEGLDCIVEEEEKQMDSGDDSRRIAEDEIAVQKNIVFHLSITTNQKWTIGC